MSPTSSSAASGRAARPAIRTIQARALLELTTSLPSRQLEQFVAKARPDALEHARRSFALAWFPMDEHMHLCEVLHDVVGRKRFVELFCSSFTTTMRSPMLAGLFGMIRRMSDDSVATLLRNAPRIYGYVSRDIGEARCTIFGEHDARFEFSDWPSASYSFDVWVAGLQGCLLGAMLGTGGGPHTSIQVDHCDAARGYGSYRICW